MNTAGPSPLVPAQLWVVTSAVSCRRCLQVLLNVLSGMIYFQEYHAMPWSNLFLFMTGYV